MEADEDSKQIGFLAEPSAEFSAAFLFTEGLRLPVGWPLELEVVLFDGIDRAVEGLLPSEDAFVKGEDVGARGGPRSNALIDAPILPKHSAFDDTIFSAMGSDGIWVGLLVSVPFDTVFVSVGRGGRSPIWSAPASSDRGELTAVPEDSDPAGWLVSTVKCLKIAVAQASSSTGSAASTVGEHGLVIEASDTFSGLLVLAAGDSGLVCQNGLLSQSQLNSLGKPPLSWPQ